MWVERLWFPPARLAAYIAVSATLTRSSMSSRSAGSKLGPSGALTMPMLAVMGRCCVAQMNSLLWRFADSVVREHIFP